MSQKCLVPICPNRTSDKDKIFVTVPRKLELQKIWWDAMKISTKNYFRGMVCEDHFDLEKDAENWIKYKLIGARLKIKEDVVPHKFIDRCPDHKISSLTNSAKKRKLENITQFEKLKNMPSAASTSKSVCRKLFEESPKRLKQSECKVSSPSGDIFIDNLETEILRPTKTVSTQTCYKEAIKRRAIVERGCSPLKEKKRNKQQQQPSLDSSPSVVPSSSTESYSAKTTSTEENKIIQSRYESTQFLLKTDPKFYLGISKNLLDVVDILSRHTKISKDHILICLFKIKLDDSYKRIAMEFNYSTSLIQKVFRKNIPEIASHLKQLIFWPKTEIIRSHIPLPFQARYNKVESVIDCFEIEIQKPGNPLLQSSTWSEYKHCNTIKYLISCTPNGFINYISEGFGGRISDTEIIKKSGYLDVVKDCDVMADRGFKHVEHLLKEKNCNLIRPPSVGPEQSSSIEVKLSKQIASLRIHVERVIRRIREFSMLRPHACLHNKLLNVLNAIVVIVCALINLQKPLL